MTSEVIHTVVNGDEALEGVVVDTYRDSRKRYVVRVRRKGELGQLGGDILTGSEKTAVRLVRALVRGDARFDR